MTQQAESRPSQALGWRVNNLQLAGLSWGAPGERPVLALHGWLDNAASFAFLAPLLQGCHVVALDLTGQGKSAWRSADASYLIWDDLPEIVGVLDALGWETFDLVGHSRGAIISTLLASAFPTRVRRLVLLDAVVPDAVPAENFPEQLRTALQDKVRLQGRSNRIFTSMEAAIESRAARGLTAAAARALVERNLRACSDGWQWTTDPRLQGASAVKLTREHLQAVLNALSMPTLLLQGQNGLGQSQQQAEYARQHIPKLVVESLPGGHHFHMEVDVERVAERISQFLTTAQECERT